MSIGAPRKPEIERNISSLLGNGGRVPPTLPVVGQVVVIDGATIEEAVRYDFQ
jgi:hypothetical protein